MDAPFKEGDRIEMVQMGEDPCPIPAGEKGTVQSCYPWSDKTWTISVRWDSGRSLSLCVPPDVARKI